MSYRGYAALLFLLFCPLTAGNAAQAQEEAKTEAVIPDQPPAAPEFISGLRDDALTEADLTIGGVAPGDSFADAVRKKGLPESVSRGNIFDECRWKDVTVRFVGDIPGKYSTFSDNGRALPRGAADIYTDSAEVKLSRGIGPGDTRENVIRTYGVPSEIAWDGSRKSFYLVYAAGKKTLSFRISNDRVAGVASSLAEKAAADRLSEQDRTVMDVRDFRLAGYEIGAVFAEHPWMVWEKKAVNPKEEIWYYPGFAVRMDSGSKIISSVFLTGQEMMTRRGVSIGDQLSTVEAIYGRPHKIEMNLSEKHPQCAYIYFSKDQRQVLIFYIDGTSKTVRGIVTMKNPQIPNPFQKTIDRIARVRAENAGAQKDHG